MQETIEKALALGNRMGHVFVATADAHGIPHVAASSKMTLEAGGRIGISEWFCPGTLSNLEVNPGISVVVWDPKNDTGFQILGERETVEDISVMDGFSLEAEEKAPLPQLERKIRVRVDKILHFSHAPHSDVEE